MSDLLSNLAARSLGFAEVVQPRVASLFEPLRTAASSAGMLDRLSMVEEVVLDARPSAALEAAHFVVPSPASSSQQDGHDAEKVRATAPATSNPPGRTTEGSWSAWVRHASVLADEGDAKARLPEPAVAPATRGHAPLRVSPPSTMRLDESGAVRRSGEISLSRPTRLALVPDGADGSENPSSHAGSESRRPASGHGHLGAFRGLGRADLSRRQAVWSAVERDGGARSPEAAAESATRLHDFPPLLLSSVVRAPETDSVDRSGLDAATTRPVRVRDQAKGGETAASTVWKVPVRPVNEGLRGSFELGPADVSRSEQAPVPDPATVGPARVVIQPRVALYSEPVGAARPRPAVRAEPTIQVTIGRVEVRATQPTAPVTPKERQAPTAMSLEEYLSRRAEGSAR